MLDGLIAVRSWDELETAFTALQRDASDLRIDHQWGAAGEYWRVAGGVTGVDRLEALARLAGAKLMDIPALREWQEIAEERNPAHRWYRALRRFSPQYRHKGYGTQHAADGSDAGVIGIATVDSACRESATLCLTMEGLSAAPAARLETLCVVPRYAGPCDQWRAAQACLAAKEPDYAGAVHSAVSAVEGMARVLLDDSTATLGAAVNELKRRGHIHGALASALHGLWGYSSEEPGIRHGAVESPAVKAHEATFAVHVCEAALTLFLTLDDGRTGRG